MRRFVTIVLLTFALALLGAQDVGAQATYVGTETCNNCHGKESNFAGNQWATWVNTKHAMKWRDPDEGIGVVSGARDAFMNNLDLSTDPDFAAFGTNAPKLSYDNTDAKDPADETSGYRVTIGTTTYVVNYTLGGTGDWKQRYMTKIGNSIYILPIQYNEKTADWVTYDPKDWYDTSNQPLAAPPKDASYERRCIGCHAVNPVVSFDQSTGEWTATKTERNVGCEACHGPGSEHANTADPTKILNPEHDLTDLNRQLEVCGACHGRGKSQAVLGGENLGYPYNDTEGHYRPGLVLADFYTQTINTSTMWPDLENSKKHHQQYIDFLSSPHGAYDPNKPWVDLTCFTCHDPHGDTPNEHMVRDKLDEDGLIIPTDVDNNTLCLACHSTHGDFSLISKEMVLDPTGANLDTIKAVVETHTRHPYDPEGTGTSRCTKCHMPEVAKSAVPYDIHGHTFHPIGPEKTLEFQAQGGMPNSCAVSCHRAGDAGAPTFGIVDASLTDWSEQSDVALADTLKKFFGTGGYWWDTDPSNNNVGVLSAVRTDNMPTVDGDDSDPVWATAPALQLPNGATLKAAYNNQKIVILAKWNDPTMSMTRGGSWQYVNGSWVNTKATQETGANEDRFNILWNINVSEFDVRGCAVKCHGPQGEEDDAYLEIPGEYADMWHMKASRALPAISSAQSGTLTFSTNDPSDTHQVTGGTIMLNGYADDKVVAARLDPVYPFDPEDGGRHGDSGTAPFRHNRNADKTAPMYMEKAPADYIDGMVLYQSEIDNGEAVEVATLSASDVQQYWDAYAAVHAVVPERIMQTPAGSRGDVHEAAIWKDGVWTAEYERDLVTGNADDVQFDDLTKPYYFGTAIMNNAGGDNHDLRARLAELHFEEFVSVADRPAKGVPSRYELAQNYPNPFNPQTMIRFSIPKAGKVSLKVYNQLGQTVAILVDKYMQPGQYQTLFVANNFASGIYYYRLEVNGFSETHKMVLLK